MCVTRCLLTLINYTHQFYPCILVISLACKQVPGVPLPVLCVEAAPNTPVPAAQQLLSSTETHVTFAWLEMHL